MDTFRQDRDNLLQTSSKRKERSQRRRRTPNNAAGGTNSTANEAAAIQQSLSRTQQLLHHELERVSHVASAIDSDQKMLKDTMDDLKTMNVSSAKKALTALERAQQRERRILMISVIFFWTVLFYVMWCRILIRIPFLDQLLNLITRS